MQVLIRRATGRGSSSVSTAEKSTSATPDGLDCFIPMTRHVQRDWRTRKSWHYDHDIATSDLRIAETRDRTGDLQIFGLTLSQLSYRG